MKFISLREDNWREFRTYITDKNNTIGIVSDLIFDDKDNIGIILGKNKDGIKMIPYFPNVNGKD